MPAIVARSVIASRNSDPLSENLTNTALVCTRLGLVVCKNVYATVLGTLST